MKCEPLLGGLATKDSFWENGGQCLFVLRSEIGWIVIRIFPPPRGPFCGDLDFGNAIPGSKSALESGILQQIALLQV